MTLHEIEIVLFEKLIVSAVVAGPELGWGHLFQLLFWTVSWTAATRLHFQRDPKL